MKADRTGHTHPLLFSGTDWDFDTIRRIYDAVEEAARDELGLDTYPNQIEVITTEQMLDAYSSTGMPQLYKHWSFGKQFAHHELVYRKGMRGLAYELVINSDPCISYVMEENTAMMQTLVIAHAAFGHNHFFKNNYLFRQWTDAEGIRDYLEFAKGYVAACEERHGQAAVEQLIDAAHSLMNQGVHRYPRRQRLDLKAEEQREAERHAYQERFYNDLWRTVPTGTQQASRQNEDKRRALLELPEENILYFLEKTAPKLAPWQREILRIVRHVAQYFYPQSQTKVMNEGCATYCHYRIMTRLHKQGSINDGAFLEFLQSHTNVVAQPTFDTPYYNGINPYALGFAMMEDIARICNVPSDEDREWFPDIAGKGDADNVLKHIWANYRDESFIAQFLSPRLIREWRIFHVADDASKNALEIAAIHDERGYRRIRRALARQYDIAWQQADIQVVDVDLAGDRHLILQHEVINGILLAESDTTQVLQNLASLWGYNVILREVDPATGKVLKEHVARATPAIAA
ncbi:MULTISPECIES: SpoVR family protein [unclassified Chelatococcus]|uniref:SpoVR family protein n=1 Tax=unclassified Chelatococcus TaxID=2638111 RepID=UPI001BCBB4C6|nr:MULTISPECIES: SpoVR family protein [unclassified Chelatococcus]MBS7700869.1 SpoVR family protein [Chelatococcus sp. YT9]MBX3555402.1 SpoVR family protein [Chelatococcus sp.]